MVGLRAKATALVAGAVAAEVGAFALTGNALLAAAMFAGSVGAGAAALRMWPRARTSEEEPEPQPEPPAQAPAQAQAPAHAPAQAPAPVPPWITLAARIDAIGDDATLLAQEGRARLAELTVGLGESRRELLDAFAKLADRAEGAGSSLRAAQDDLAEAQSARFDAIDGALQALASAADVEGARTIQGFDEIQRSLRAASERGRDAEERLHARVVEVDAGLAALAGAVAGIQDALERKAEESSAHADRAAGRVEALVERLQGAIERASASSASRIDDAAGGASRRLDDLDATLRSLWDDVEQVHRAVERASHDGGAREARAADLMGGRIDALEAAVRALATVVAQARQEHGAVLRARTADERLQLDAWSTRLEASMRAIHAAFETASRTDTARFDTVDATLASLVSAREQEQREQDEAQRAQAAEGRAQLDAWSGRIDASVLALHRTIERSSQALADRADAASQTQLEALTRNVDAATAATHRAVMDASREAMARSEALAEQATGRLDRLDATLIDLAASAGRGRDEARTGLDAIEEALRGSDAAAKTRADAAHARFDKVDAELASISADLGETHEERARLAKGIAEVSALVDERARETARAAKMAAAEANKQTDARARSIERAIRGEGRRAAKSEAVGRRATHRRLDGLQESISTAVDEAAQRIDAAADARQTAASAKAESLARARHDEIVSALEREGDEAASRAQRAEQAADARADRLADATQRARDAVAERVADEASRLAARLDAAHASAHVLAQRHDAAAREGRDALKEAIAAASRETMERVHGSAAAHERALERRATALADQIARIDAAGASRDAAMAQAVLSTREALASEAEEHARRTAERLDALAAASAAAHDATIAHLAASAQDQRHAFAQLRAGGEAHAKALDAARRELARAIDAARDTVVAREEAVARTADDILDLLQHDTRIDTLASSLDASSTRTMRALASLRSDVGTLAKSADLRALGTRLATTIAKTQRALAAGQRALASDVGSSCTSVERALGALEAKAAERAKAHDSRSSALHDGQRAIQDSLADVAERADAILRETAAIRGDTRIAAALQAQREAIDGAADTMGSRIDALAEIQRADARRIEDRVLDVAEGRRDLQASIDGVREELQAAVEIDAARLDAARSSLASEIGGSTVEILRSIEAASGSIAEEIRELDERADARARKLDEADASAHAALRKELERRDARLETALDRLAAEHDPTRALIRATRADAQRTLVARFDALGALQNEAAVHARETEARLDATIRALREEQARLAEGARSHAERIAEERRDSAKIDRDSILDAGDTHAREAAALVSSLSRRVEAGQRAILGSLAASERRLVADARAGSEAQREALARLVEILVANREEEAARHERLARALDALSDQMLAAQEHARGEAATLRAMVRDARRDERERMMTFAGEIGRRFEATDAALAELARPPPPPLVLARANEAPAVDLGEWEDPVDPDAALFAVLRPRVRRA